MRVSPQVSVLMGVYNRESLVGQAIRSVLRQTFLDFEFIIMDDGSCDSTWKSLTSFKDPRLKLFRWDKNRGVSCARNEAFRHARGRWVTFFDSDDLMTPRSLEVRLSALKASNRYQVVVGRMGKVLAPPSDRHAQEIRRVKANLYPFLRRVGEVPLGFIKETMRLPSPLTTQIFSKTLLQELGPLDEKLRCCDDLDLAIRVNEVAPSLFVDFPVLHYRIHQTNISLKDSPEKWLEIRTVWERWAPWAVHRLKYDFS